jgi:hypothetical protein
MLCIWVLPLAIWLPVYFLLVPNQTAECLLQRELAKRVFWIALPSLYIPAAILV